jgi:hypothetical protein
MLSTIQKEMCAILAEDCCFWVKRSGQVLTNIHVLTYLVCQLIE